MPEELLSHMVLQFFQLEFHHTAGGHSLFFISPPPTPSLFFFKAIKMLPVFLPSPSLTAPSLFFPLLLSLTSQFSLGSHRFPSAWHHTPPPRVPGLRLSACQTGVSTIPLISPVSGLQETERGFGTCGTRPWTGSAPGERIGTGGALDKAGF